MPIRYAVLPPDSPQIPAAQHAVRRWLKVSRQPVLISPAEAEEALVHAAAVFEVFPGLAGADLGEYVCQVVGMMDLGREYIALNLLHGRLAHEGWEERFDSLRDTGNRYVLMLYDATAKRVPRVQMYR